MTTQLQPASTDDHVWYHSEGDDQPLPSQCPTDTNAMSGQMTEKDAHGPAPGMYMSSIRIYVVHSYSDIDVRRIQQAGRGKKMAQAITFEKVDELGNPV